MTEEQWQAASRFVTQHNEEVKDAVDRSSSVEGILHRLFLSMVVQTWARRSGAGPFHQMMMGAWSFDHPSAHSEIRFSEMAFDPADQDYWWCRNSANRHLIFVHEMDLKNWLIHARRELVESIAPFGAELGASSYEALPEPNENRDPTTEQEVSEAIAEVTEVIVTGMPGRPSSKHLYLEEFRRRINAGEVSDKLSDETKYLSSWLAEKHPRYPQAGPGSIENQIRDEHKAYKNRSGKQTTH